MNCFKRVVILLFWAPVLLAGQPVFEMSNATVSDCKGFLVDSGEGQPAGNYDHDENFTFTICIPGATSIKLSFSSFCTEQDYDILRIFDGADTLAPLVGGPYSGTTLPSTVVSTGECLTIHFVSDANVTCTGWVANWTTQIQAPDLPDLTISDNQPACSTDVVVVSFDQPLPCDSLLAGAFSVNGPIANGVTNATVLNCANDSATSVQLTLAPGLDESGLYVVTYSGSYLDACDSLWLISTSDSLWVDDCPLRVELLASSDTICQGSCTDIFAEVKGGDPLTYNFVWNIGLPNGAGPFQVCPPVSTTYWVTVNDASGAAPASDTITITVLPQPTVSAGQTLCESAPPIALTGTPAGGIWSGPGMSSSGIFDPGQAGGGSHAVTYTAPNGCPATTVMGVQEIDAGPPAAACPGSAPFNMTGASPPNGTWSGPNINAGGVVTPPAGVTSFWVYYTFSGCSDSTLINIDNPASAIPDTVCESQDPLTFTGIPAGGFWIGSGITDPVAGTFDPAVAGPGDHVLTYQINGCNQQLSIHVKELNIGNNFVACPDEAPFTLGTPNPPGGVWSSINGGIIDPATGLFNPGALGGSNFVDTISYSVNGCTAKIIGRVIRTAILLNPDTLSFCLSDPVIELNWANVKRTPGNGNWSGAGITDPNFPGEFDPDVAGPGVHKLVYLANTCADSMTMVVWPPSIPADTSVCASANSFSLPTLHPGGSWWGVGISDSSSGVFDPQISGTGFHRVYYENPMGCLDSALIEVYPLPTLNIGGLDPQYCFKDSSYQLLGQPAGGTFSGPGIIGNSFNPALAGPGGPHVITYTFGQGDCQQSITSITAVSPPLAITLSSSQDSICAGTFVQLSAVASGGATGAFTYQWLPGGSGGAFLSVSPDQTTTYTVAASDGCSDPAIASFEVFVYPPFTVDVGQSPPVCFGDSGYAFVVVNGLGQYQIDWQTNPPQSGDTLFAPTGFNYPFTVVDINSGCSTSGLAEIPRYPFVRADFIPNPDGQCAKLSDPVFQFLDQSTGATMGTWDFGDGTQADYQAGENPSHSYPQTGTYIVTLVLSNDGGCADSVQAEVCVEPDRSYVYLPNAFTPNDDGTNDTWGIVATGIIRYELTIYDQWGKQVFYSQDPLERWDGRSRGQPVPEGVYLYYLRGTITSNNPRINFGPEKLEEKGTITLLR